MMTQAFYTGISGLKANQVAIDVISDNLSNTSTVGYRGYSTEFSNLFEGMINTTAATTTTDDSVGVGTKLNTIVMDESRGVFKLSERSTDLAILGDGWFGIQGHGKTMYTRDGSFTFDANRDLVTPDGFYILGTMGDNIDNGILSPQVNSTPLGAIGTQEKLRFPKELTFPTVPTTEVTIDGNLSLSDSAPALTISSEIITTEGVKNNLRLEFSKVDPQVAPGSQWNVVATAETRDGETVYATESGIVTFSETGAQLSNTLTSIDNQGTTVNIDLGSGFDGVVSTGAIFTSSSSSNGLEEGSLLGYDINKDAEVIATFSNGMQSSVGRIGVFHFSNDRGLERVNGARFVESKNSGDAVFATDSDGNSILGTDITNYKLEGSNVRMEVGLTEIIVMQRAYDANSKSVSTADQMLQKALSMDA